MKFPFFPFVNVVGLLVATLTGCGTAPTPTADPAPEQVNSDKQPQPLAEIVQAKRSSAAAKSPEPVMTVVTPRGWKRGAPRPLPPETDGFTIAYDHELGMAVTLYQYTRGLKTIPNDVNAAPIQEELNHAKNGIHKAVELGLWQAAVEKTNDTVTLGDSPQQALWSRFELTVDGQNEISDTYVWSSRNAFLKLRCTSRVGDVMANESILKPLLTAFGEASLPKK